MRQNTVIYLDYAATSPARPEVCARMLPCLQAEGPFANPASLHAAGLEARETVEAARAEIASVLNADPTGIVFTSGATESCNLAIKGAAQLHTSRGRHIVTWQTEHAAVLDSCEALEKQGFQITRLAPRPDGLVDPAALIEALRPDTVLVSLMQVNNETGVIQDIAGIARLTAERGILLHVDAAQAIGKTGLDVSKVPVDLVSLSAHKCGGPKGIGALYLRRKPRVRVAAQIHGGGQEQGQRSGTLPVHQIAGMAEAFRLASAERDKEHLRIHRLRQSFLDRLAEAQPILHGDPDKCVPHILNLRFPHVLAKPLLGKCPGLAISTGSACHGKSHEPSPVLRAMGLGREEALSALRISFGWRTTDEEIRKAADILLSALRTL